MGCARVRTVPRIEAVTSYARFNLHCALSVRGMVRQVVEENAQGERELQLIRSRLMHEPYREDFLADLANGSGLSKAMIDLEVRAPRPQPR